jgi:hypothetical protein
MICQEATFDVDMQLKSTAMAAFGLTLISLLRKCRRRRSCAEEASA